MVDSVASRLTCSREFAVKNIMIFCNIIASFLLYTVFQKKTSTHIIGYKLRNSCPILIIFDTKIPHII